MHNMYSKAYCLTSRLITHFKVTPYRYPAINSGLQAIFTALNGIVAIYLRSTGGKAGLRQPPCLPIFYTNNHHFSRFTAFHVIEGLF